MKVFLSLAERSMMGFTANFLVSILPCVAYDTQKTRILPNLTMRHIILLVYSISYRGWGTWDFTPPSSSFPHQALLTSAIYMYIVLVLLSHPKTIMSPTLPYKKSQFCMKHWYVCTGMAVQVLAWLLIVSFCNYYLGKHVNSNLVWQLG